MSAWFPHDRIHVSIVRTPTDHRLVLACSGDVFKAKHNADQMRKHHDLMTQAYERLQSHLLSEASLKEFKTALDRWAEHPEPARRPQATAGAAQLIAYLKPSKDVRDLLDAYSVHYRKMQSFHLRHRVIQRLGNDERPSLDAVLDGLARHFNLLLDPQYARIKDRQSLARSKSRASKARTPADLIGTPLDPQEFADLAKHHQHLVHDFDRVKLRLGIDPDRKLERITQPDLAIFRLPITSEAEERSRAFGQLQDLFIRSLQLLGFPASAPPEESKGPSEPDSGVKPVRPNPRVPVAAR